MQSKLRLSRGCHLGPDVYLVESNFCRRVGTDGYGLAHRADVYVLGMSRRVCIKVMPDEYVLG